MIDLKKIPDSPGCYIYKDKDNIIIYIGKAKNLRKRVASYFSSRKQDPKTNVLVKNISSVDFIITGNEIEALILENNLVKKHQPKYNIDLKDSKRFAYIALTKEEYPRVLLARDQTMDAHYFGPFTSAAERDIIIQTINQHFQLRTCKRLPKKECTRYHIKLCPAPCIGLITRFEYEKNIAKVRAILNGKTKSLSEELEAHMKIYSEKLDYEKALEARDQILALERLIDNQNMERNKKYDEDVIAYLVNRGKIYVLVFNVYRGMLVNKKDFVLEERPNFLPEFLVRYYSENSIPSEIILQEKTEETITDFLSKSANKRVRLYVPQKGEKKELLELAKRNIEVSFFAGVLKTEALKDRLRLQDPPSIIECFDISHLSGTSMVGSMVQFKEGVPNKSSYRRFKIRTIEKVDDFAAIAEVVRRRYSRLLSERQDFPNLIVIDGGIGQLHSAMEELKKLNLRIPVISIAKRFEEIYVPGISFPLKLDRKDKALQLIQEIRDEAHRFAINYNKLLRKKRMLK